MGGIRANQTQAAGKWADDRTPTDLAARSSVEPARRRRRRALLVLPPARISHEIDMYRAVDDLDLVVVTGRGSPLRADFPLPVMRVPYVGAPGRWAAGLHWLRGIDEVDPGPVDVVVSLEILSVTSYLASRLARRLGRPHVVQVADVLIANPLYRMPPWRQITAHVVANADGFICDTKAARDLVVARGADPERARVVYPGVDLEVFAPPDLPRREPLLAFAGDLRPDRGLDDIVAACDLVAARVDGFRLVVVGDGPVRAQVDRLAETRDYLRVDGRVTRSDVARLFRSARAFVTAPRERRFWSEQFGFAMVEAMASGLPVVATRSGAIPEVLPSGNFLVPERDVGALASAIAKALGPKGEAVGHANLEVAHTKYSLARQSDRLAAALARFAALDHGSQIG